MTPIRTPGDDYLDLPERWKKKLSEYVLSRSGGKYSLPGAGYFNQTLIIRFPDGSFIMFTSAFALEAEEWGQIGVFTEHCGYHLFPFNGTKIVNYDH